MVILEKTTKKLVVPSGLGNKATGGGSVDPEVIDEIVDSAITDYDTNVVEPKIAALSGATSALTNDVNSLDQKVENLSASTSSLTEDITLLETTVGNHTTDIQEISGNTGSLSAATVSMGQQVATLAASAATKDYVDSALTAYTPTENFAKINGSAVTAGGNIVINGGDYKVVTSLPASAEIGQLFYLLDSQLTLSGVVWDASETTAATYDECYVGMLYNTSVSGHNVFISISNTSGEFFNGGISQLPTESLDNSGAVVKYNGIGNLNFYYKIDKERRLIYLWPNEESVLIVKKAHAPGDEYDIITATTSSLTVYEGAGTTYRYTSAGYVKADATTKKQCFIDDMSTAELAELYATLSALTSGNTSSANVPKIFEDYDFYVKWEIDGQQWAPAYFSNWENGNKLLITGSKPSKDSYGLTFYASTAEIYASGYYQYVHRELPDYSHVGNDISIHLDSAGTITNASSLGHFSSLNSFNKYGLEMWGDNNLYAWGKLDYFWRRMENINGEDKLVEYIGGTINAYGTTYKGTWHFIEWEWGERVTADTWTVVN